MAMSAGGNDGLFRLAESAAPEEGRIMPSERKYLKSNKTVSLQDAISLMKQRKSHPEDKIPGGLDDNSQNVRKSVHKVKKDETATPPAAATEDTTRPDATETINASEAYDIFAGLLEDAKTKDSVKSSKAKGVLGRVTLYDIMTAVGKLGSQVAGLGKIIQTLKDFKNSSGEGADKTSPLQTFKAGRHKVTFLVNNMEFTVKCLNMVRDEASHCLVLAFEDDSDSFFTPPMQSELTIRYDGLQEPGKLFYFGMCFSIKSLGLKFLGFLLDSHENNQ